MKIVHVINSLETGGAESLVVDMSKQLTNLGHQVRIISLSGKDGAPLRRAKELGLDVRILDTSPRDPRSVLRLRKLTEDSDIVNAHLFPSQYWCSFLKGPKVFTEHSTINRRLNNKSFAPLEKYSYQRYDAVIAVGDGVTDVFRLYFEKLRIKTPIFTILNGISPDYFKIQKIRDTSAKRNSPHRVLSVARLVPLKRLERALETISLTADVTYQIAGDGPLSQELKNYAERLGIADRTTFLGNVFDIKPIFAEADVFLNTSDNEGLPMSVLEAQAAGIPVVGPRIGGMRSAVSDSKSGILYDGYDPQVISDCLKKVLSPQQHEEFVAGARSFAQSFSIEGTTEKYLQVYHDILHK